MQARDVKMRVCANERLAAGAVGLGSAPPDVEIAVVVTAKRRRSPRSDSPGRAELIAPFLPPLSSPISCRAPLRTAQSHGDTSLNFIVDYPSERRGRGRRPLPVSKLEATEEWGRRLRRKVDLWFHLDDFHRQGQSSLAPRAAMYIKYIYGRTYVQSQPK